MDNALFLVKKVLGGLLMPVPMLLLLLLWGLLLLLRRKTRWLGYICILLATGLLFCASYAPISTPLTMPLEQEYPAYQPGDRPVAYVAVLGEGHSSGPGLPVSSEINPAGVVRLVEGIRVYRLNPGSKLIFTGYKAQDRQSYPELMRQLALSLGVPENDILAFTGPRDTLEEAQLIARQFAGAPLALVTSAAHMPRAIGLFHKLGLQPIPAPTNHLSRPTLSYWQFPRAETLKRNQDWLHEELGLLWARLMGQLAPEENPQVR